MALHRTFIECCLLLGVAASALGQESAPLPKRPDRISAQDPSRAVYLTQAVQACERIWHAQIDHWNIAALGEYATNLSALKGMQAELVHAEWGGTKNVPFKGYYFKLLLKQGPDADGCSKSYVQEGRMTEGFAIIAWPADYMAGAKSYLFDSVGTVFSKDLGNDSAGIAAAMEVFNPDKSWERHSRPRKKEVSGSVDPVDIDD